MISWSRRRTAKDKLGRHYHLTGEGMFSPAGSIDVHWFGKARAGLELLGKQKTTPPRVLVGSWGSGRWLRRVVGSHVSGNTGPAE